jgi:predicted ATPase/transcriptional regulator with XRE-family HTH domain
VDDEQRLPRSSDFGALLRRHRLAAGLSQDALAERARMSADAISSLERGHRRTPRRDTLALLAGALALDSEQRQEFEVAAVRPGAPRGPATASVTVGPWAESAASSLPIALTSFVGRDEELTEIAMLMRDHRMVTIVGAGGIGKTQTALHVASGLSGDSVVCFVALASIADPSLLGSAVAAALGVQNVPGRPLVETLIAYLKYKALVLLLDNCEHVISEAAIFAAAILGGCPRIRILATSREPLRAGGEYAYRLPSLSFPSPDGAGIAISAADASAYGVIVLFADRARAVNHSFALTDENAPVIAEICRRLDGIPLAIELAAARVNLLTVNAIAERLDDRFRLLTGGERIAVPRHQTMRATIDWSYDLLSPPEQQLFQRLSIFAGGCTLAAAAAVCGDEGPRQLDVLNLLSSLVDKSLVVADFNGGEARYRLLESFREYARERLTTRDRDVVAHLHALAYLDLAKTADEIFLYQPNEDLQARALQELDNWRAALGWALTDRADVLLGQRLVGALCALWLQLAPLEGRRWLHIARALADEHTPTSVLARLDYTEATVAHALGPTEVQLASSRSAIARYRVVGDSLGIVLAQYREAAALQNLGRNPEAKRVLSEALPLARSSGNRWLVASILRWLALVSDDSDVKRAYTLEALELFGSTGNRFDAGFTMLQLSAVEYERGNGELALSYASTAVATFRAIAKVRGVVAALNEMALRLIELNRFAEAAASAREALELATEYRWELATAGVLLNLSAIAALRSARGQEVTPDAWPRLVQVFGFASAYHAKVGRPLDKQDQLLFDRTIAVLREALGTDAVALLMAEGAHMTEEQAIGEIWSLT